MRQNATFAFFVELEGQKFRLATCAALHKSRLLNLSNHVHSEYWECPGGLANEVVKIARNNQKMLKFSRRVFISSRRGVRASMNEAKWMVYKPILPVILNVTPFSTLNSGPISFGHTTSEMCPIRVAQTGLRHGVHPDALFFGTKGLETINRLGRNGDTVLFFDEAKIVKKKIWSPQNRN